MDSKQKMPKKPILNKIMILLTISAECGTSKPKKSLVKKDLQHVKNESKLLKR